jgi:hypothetical protein
MVWPIQPALSEIGGFALCRLNTQTRLCSTAKRVAALRLGTSSFL